MRTPWLGGFARHLARTVLAHCALACGAGLVLFSLIDAVELGNRLAPRAAWADLVALELWGLPRVLRQILGFGTLLGVLTATGHLVRRGEIFAVLAAGGSPATVLRPVLLVGAVLGTGHAGLTEWVVPRAQARVSELRARLGLPVRRSELLARPSVWFRGADRFFRVDDLGAEDGRTLVRVLMLRTDGGRLVERWDADRLDWDGASWTATGLVHRRLDPDHAFMATRSATAALSLRERPEDFVRRVGLASRLPLGALLETVRARRRLGRNTAGHRLEVGRRLAGPLSLLLGAVLSAGIAMRLGRRPSLASALGAGAAVGLAFWLAEELANGLATVGMLAPEVCALGVPLLAGAGAAAVWWHPLRPHPRTP